MFPSGLEFGLAKRFLRGREMGLGNQHSIVRGDGRFLPMTEARDPDRMLVGCVVDLCLLGCCRLGLQPALDVGALGLGLDALMGGAVESERDVAGDRVDGLKEAREPVVFVERLVRGLFLVHHAPQRKAALAQLAEGVAVLGRDEDADDSEEGLARVEPPCALYPFEAAATEPVQRELDEERAHGAAHFPYGVRVHAAVAGPWKHEAAVGGRQARREALDGSCLECPGELGQCPLLDSQPHFDARVGLILSLGCFALAHGGRL